MVQGLHMTIVATSVQMAFNTTHHIMKEVNWAERSREGSRMNCSTRNGTIHTAIQPYNITYQRRGYKKRAQE